MRVALSFSDPQSLTINAITTSLPRTVTLPTASTFQSADNLLTLLTSQSAGKRYRSLARVDVAKIDPANGERLSFGVYTVIDRPVVGFTTAEVLYAVTGLTAWGSASTNANWTKLIERQA